MLRCGAMRDLPEDIRNLLDQAGFDPDTGKWRESDPANGICRISIEPRTVNTYWCALTVNDQTVATPHEVHRDGLAAFIDGCGERIRNT